MLWRLEAQFRRRFGQCEGWAGQGAWEAAGKESEREKKHIIRVDPVKARKRVHGLGWSAAWSGGGEGEVWDAARG